MYFSAFLEFQSRKEMSALCIGTLSTRVVWERIYRPGPFLPRRAPILLWNPHVALADRQPQ